MIVRADILSMEYLKKTEFTGCHKGMRYRLEKASVEDKVYLKTTVWPEPFNYISTPAEQKTEELFSFDEDGVVDAIGWMNNQLFEKKDIWEHAASNWNSYSKY